MQLKRSGYDFNWVNHLDLDHGQGIVAFDVVACDLKSSLYTIPLQVNPRRGQSLPRPNLFWRPPFQSTFRPYPGPSSSPEEGYPSPRGKESGPKADGPDGEGPAWGHGGFVPPGRTGMDQGNRMANGKGIWPGGSGTPFRHHPAVRGDAGVTR
jgi:hypothetical protein